MLKIALDHGKSQGDRGMLAIGNKNWCHVQIGDHRDGRRVLGHSPHWNQEMGSQESGEFRKFEGSVGSLRIGFKNWCHWKVESSEKVEGSVGSLEIGIRI